MTKEAFEMIIAEEFSVVPARFFGKIKNLGFVVEDEPDQEVRQSEGLEPNETLLGLYRGVPLSERGDAYGIGMTLPDTITIYQKPIVEAAGGDPEEIRRIVRETIWHEVGHYFGLKEPEVQMREMRRRDERA